MTLTPPFAYFGGKTTLAPRIASLLPEHRHYVEPFAGSLAVLLSKQPAPYETVNDLDGNLMTFWRVLRDRPAELAERCWSTPHARAEHDLSYDLEVSDELEQARRIWVRLTQGRGGTMRRTGWRHFQNPGVRSSTSMPDYLEAYVDRMAPVAARLRQVSLECRPALELVEAYGRHAEVCLYVDPPYLGHTRSVSSRYAVEMHTPAEHQHLADALRGCAAAVVISGYPSPLYDDWYADWHRIDLEAFTGQANLHAGAGRRTEVLLVEPAVHRAPDADGHLGGCMTDYPLARCEHTGLVLGECAESCCRPDLAHFQPVPEVWMRVTEPAGRPVVPSSADVAEGNVHALLQVVSGRTARPDVVDMVRELCEPSAHLVRYDGDQGEQQTQPVRRSKGKARRKKAGRSAGRAPRYHRTVEPPLLEQLYESVEPSSSAEAGAARPASSRPAARLDAIDTANRIDILVGRWLNRLDETAITISRPAGRTPTERELQLHDSISRLRHLASLGPSLQFCGWPVPHARDEKTRRPTCCACHELEDDITRWWTWARVVTGWDAAPFTPNNTCPLCGTRGSVRIRFELQRATCVVDACRETWDTATIGLLAEHIRRENNDLEAS